MNRTISHVLGSTWIRLTITIIAGVLVGCVAKAVTLVYPDFLPKQGLSFCFGLILASALSIGDSLADYSSKRLIGSLCTVSAVLTVIFFAAMPSSPFIVTLTAASIIVFLIAGLSMSRGFDTSPRRNRIIRWFVLMLYGIVGMSTILYFVMQVTPPELLPYVVVTILILAGLQFLTVFSAMKLYRRVIYSG